MIQPNLSEIASALDNLATVPAQWCQHAYVAGYLSEVLRIVADVHDGEAHNGEISTGCSTCWWIRAGMAMIAAADLHTGQPVAGDGGV